MKTPLKRFTVVNCFVVGTLNIALQRRYVARTVYLLQYQEQQDCSGSKSRELWKVAIIPKVYTSKPEEARSITSSLLVKNNHKAGGMYEELLR